MTDLFGNQIVETKTIDPEEFRATWNQHKNLPGIAFMSSDRKKKLALRCQIEQFRDNWRHMLDVMNTESEFLGQNRSGWRANVDFLLRNDINWVRVIEKYPPQAEERPTGLSPKEQLLQRIGGKVRQA